MSHTPAAESTSDPHHLYVMEEEGVAVPTCCCCLLIAALPLRCCTCTCTHALGAVQVISGPDLHLLVLLTLMLLLMQVIDSVDGLALLDLVCDCPARRQDSCCCRCFDYWGVWWHAVEQGVALRQAGSIRVRHSHSPTCCRAALRMSAGGSGDRAVHTTALSFCLLACLRGGQLAARYCLC